MKDISRRGIIFLNPNIMLFLKFFWFLIKGKKGTKKAILQQFFATKLLKLAEPWCWSKCCYPKKFLIVAGDLSKVFSDMRKEYNWGQLFKSWLPKLWLTENYNQISRQLVYNPYQIFFEEFCHGH